MADEDPPEPDAIDAPARATRAARAVRAVPACEADERALAKLRHPSMRHRQPPAPRPAHDT